MRISVIVTDDDGNIFQGEADLAASSTARSSSKRVKRQPTKKTLSIASVNFSSPIRAFVKRYAREMGGPQKFVLLVAYLSKSDTHKEVRVADVEKHWNKMKPLLNGRFNVAYPTRAKENGWVDSPKRGTYVLLPSWKGIFNA